MGSGKTTLALTLKRKIPNAIILDGDTMREVWSDLGFSKNDRKENNMRIMKIASIIDQQDVNVIVSVICPYKKLRDTITEEYPEIIWVYVAGGHEIDVDHPYEIPRFPNVSVFPYMQTPDEEANRVIDELNLK